jgi:hypothetical protein
MVVGCGPKGSRETGAGCRPFDLKIEPDHKTLTILWKINCDHLTSGYNIYISDEPLSKKYPGRKFPESIKPFNTTIFPGDTDPNDGLEHFKAKGLENGRKYYVSVRTVMSDLTMSRPSKEIAVSCGVHRVIQLATRYTGEQDGFSLERGEYVRVNDLANDLYFFSRDGVDFISSPNLLDGFLRMSRMEKLSLQGSMAEVKARLPGQYLKPYENRIRVKSGEWFMLRTDDGKDALVKVLSFDGEGDDRTVKLQVGYFSVAEELLL